MRLTSGDLQMMGRRIVLAGGAGIVCVGGVQLSGFLALAALDGGRELPGWVFYSIPILATLLLPVLLILGLFPKGRWHGWTVGLGGAIGASVLLLTATHPDKPATWLLTLPAVGAFVGTFAWVPRAGAVTAGSAQP